MVIKSCRCLLLESREVTAMLSFAKYSILLAGVCWLPPCLPSLKLGSKPRFYFFFLGGGGLFLPIPPHTSNNFPAPRKKPHCCVLFFFPFCSALSREGLPPTLQPSASISHTLLVLQRSLKGDQSLLRGSRSCFLFQGFWCGRNEEKFLF